MTKPCAAPVKVALRTQARSMAAPLVARLNRQTRGARFVTRAAVDKSQVTLSKSFVLHMNGLQEGIAVSAVGNIQRCTSPPCSPLFLFVVKNFFIRSAHLMGCIILRGGRPEATVI